MNDVTAFFPYTRSYFLELSCKHLMELSWKHLLPELLRHAYLHFSIRSIVDTQKLGGTCGAPLSPLKRFAVSGRSSEALKSAGAAILPGAPPRDRCAWHVSPAPSR